MSESDDKLAAEILALFDPETSAAIHQSTLLSIAKDFNLPTQELQHLLEEANLPATVDLRFYSKRLTQLV